MTDTASPTSGRTAGLAHRLPFPAAFAAAVVVPAVVAIVVSAIIAAIAHGAGASHDFKALTLSAFGPFIVIGLLAGAIGWTLIRRRSADPAGVLRWLVPAVVLVSLIPDILVGASGSMKGASWGGITALMAMHLVVAVCGVAAYRIFLPLNETGTARGA